MGFIMMICGYADNADLRIVLIQFDSIIIASESTICISALSVYPHNKKIYDNKLSRDCAVLFTIRVLNNNLTSEDKKHFYNVYKFIQTHPNVFGDRIRYHVRNTLEKKLTQKQQLREKKYKLFINDYSETDTDSSESESENGNGICESCNQFYDQNCACYD